jgi:PAS domain S-box-containing protein
MRPRVGQSRAYILAFALGAVLLAAFVGYRIASSYQSELAHWEERQSSVADERAQRIADWLNERQADAELFSTRPSIRGALRSHHASGPLPGPPRREQPDLTAILDQMAKQYNYSGVYVLDRKAQVVAQSSRSVALNPALADVSRAAGRAEGVRIDLLGDTPEKTLISFSVPVFPEPGRAGGGRIPSQPLGVALLLSDASQTLFRLVTREGVPTRTAETVLVRTEGEEVVFFSPLRHVPAGSPNPRFSLPAAPLPARAALEGGRTSVASTDYRGVPVLTATRRIPLTGWGLVRKIDRAEALERFHRQVTVEGLAAGLLVVLLGGVLISHRRHVLTRVMKQEGEKFRGLLESAPDSMLISDKNARIELVNQPAVRMFEYNQEELMGMPVDSLLAEESRGLFQEQYARFLPEAGGRRKSPTFELTGLRKDGSRFPAEIGLSMLRTPERTFIISAIRDITERERAEEELRRLNRALRTLSECNQAMVRARKEPELLEEVCRILVSEGGYRLAWVGYAEKDEAKSVRAVAFAGAEEGYLETLKLTWDDTERGRGPTGLAIRTGEPQMARNIREDPQFAPWREEAVRRGYNSSIALPLSVEGQCLGALMLYSSSVDSFDAQEIKLLSELAHDLGYGIQGLRTRAERQQAEEAFRRANAYNRGLIEASLDPLVTIAPDGKVTDVNSATEQVTGRSRRELIGTDFCDYFTDPDKARRGYQQVFREGWVQDYELEIQHADRHTTPVLYNATVYRDEAGRVIGVFAAARDITEKKRAQQVVEAERARFNSILDRLPVYVVLLTPDYHVPFANRFFRERFGESHGRRCYEYLFGRTEPCEICETYKVLESKAPHEWEWTGPDGRDYQIYDFPFTDADGSPLILEMGMDVTERKRAETEIRHLNESLEQRVRERTAELEATNKELEAFTYSVSHDLRAPLRHVDGFSKLLTEEYAHQLPQEARHYLDRIRGGTRQMGQLVDDLLNLSRVGRMELRLQITGLGSLAEEAIGELQAENPGRKIEWKISSLPFVECDPSLMKQVFANLLSNAIKFTRPRETAVIEVGAERQDGAQVVFVRDNGVGFSMKYADKLFGVFQRLHRPEEFEGTGVGLATVQRIIAKHHGRVWAAAALDQGATFYFSLEDAGLARPRELTS